MSRAPQAAVYETTVVDVPLAQCGTLLCPERLDILARIAHPQARAASLTGDLLLCAAVRRAVPDAVFPLVRAARPSGQPYLPDFPNLHISLSHSGNTVLCAVADVPVGIDVELPRPVRPGLAARWFDAHEQALIARDPAAFFDLWMAKEAVLKEIGCGLARGLRAVSIDLTPAPRLTAPVFGQLHSLTPVSLATGARAMVSTPGSVCPILTHTVLNMTDFL